MPFLLSEPSYKSLFVQVIAEGGAALGCATAFVGRVGVLPPFLVTNWHVVSGRRPDDGRLLSQTGAIPGALRVSFTSRRGRGHWDVVELPLYAEGEPTWIEHPIHGKAVDVVALPLPRGRDDLVFEHYDVLPLVNSKIEPAQMVSVVGFPFCEKTAQGFAVWATGFVASEPDFDHGGRPVFLIDCRTRYGQSGAPVVLHHGYHAKNGNAIGFQQHTEFLGVYSGRIHEESDLGTVWKSSVVGELLHYAAAIEAG